MVAMIEITLSLKMPLEIQILGEIIWPTRGTRPDNPALRVNAVTVGTSDSSDTSHASAERTH
jgi:hypothetical protein